MNAMAPRDDRRRLPLDVDGYLCLHDAGLLGTARTELIDGDILLMNSQFRPHAYAHSEMAFRLRPALDRLSTGLTLLIEASVAMPPSDVPQPDLILTRQPRGRGPIPLASVALIVEVADTTAGFDLGVKAALYARHGVPEYWVVDVNRRQIVGHSAPVDGRYSLVATTAFGDDLAAATIPGLTITTNGLD